MNGSTGQMAAEGRGSAARTAGVTVTAIALFAVAVFVGTRRAGEGPPPGVALGPTAPAAPAAAPAEAPAAPAAKHAPRHLQEANRHELKTTIPRGASVYVTANAGDPEAYRLAEEIQAFLFLNGYLVSDVTRSISKPPAKGVGLEPLPKGRWRVIVGSADE